MKPICLLMAGACLIVSVSVSHAQYFPQHRWSFGYGGSGTDVPQGMAADLYNHIVLVGSFEGSVDFGGGPLTSAGGSDIFVACFDYRWGDHLWSKRFGSTGDDVAYGVVAHNVFTGSAYDFQYTVTGSFGGTVNFGGSDLASAGGTDGFLARFNLAGDHLWSARFGDAGNDAGYGIGVAASHGVVVTGCVGDTQAGTTDMLIARYDATGTQLWSHVYGGPLDDAGRSVSSGVVTGEFRGQGSFGGSPLMSAGGSDIFVAKYDDAGAHLWSQRFGGTQDDAGLAVATPPVYCTGYFRGTVDFGGGNLVSAGGEDMFLLKLDANGAHQYSRRYGGTGDDAGTAVVLDYLGGPTIDVVGRFQNTVNFGSSTLTSAGGTDGFFSIFTDSDYLQNNHNLRNVRLGGPGDDSARAIADLFFYYVPESVEYDVVIAGAFSATIDLGGGPLVSAGGEDAFMVYYNESRITPVSGLPIDRLAIASYPNPFNPVTTIRYVVPDAGAVTVAVYDVSGSRVATLVDNPRHAAGSHEVRWEGRGDNGVPVASGVYFAQVEHDGVKRSARLVMLK